MTYNFGQKHGSGLGAPPAQPELCPLALLSNNEKSTKEESSTYYRHIDRPEQQLNGQDGRIGHEGDLNNPRNPYEGFNWQDIPEVGFVTMLFAAYEQQGTKSGLLTEASEGPCLTTRA